MIKIDDMGELELDSYIKQCDQILGDNRLQALILLDPSHEIAVNTKTLGYRLKEEKLLRSIVDLDAAWNDRLSNVKFAELTPEEMDIAFPELKKYLDTKEKAEADAQAAKDAEEAEDAAVEGATK